MGCKTILLEKYLRYVIRQHLKVKLIDLVCAQIYLKCHQTVFLKGDGVQNIFLYSILSVCKNVMEGLSSTGFETSAYIFKSAGIR